MQKNNEVIDFFGKNLVEGVNDLTIEQIERLIKGEVGDNLSQEIYNNLKGFDKFQIQTVRSLVPIIVIATISNFLYMLEHSEEIRVSVDTGEKSTQNLAVDSDGLTGELYGEGWIKKFSRYRHLLPSNY